MLIPVPSGYEKILRDFVEHLPLPFNLKHLSHKLEVKLFLGAN